MLWTSQAEDIIRDSLERARQHADAEYRQAVHYLWLLYHGDHEDLTRAALRQYYRETYANCGDEVWIDYCPLVTRLVDTAAVCFAREPMIQPVDRETGIPLQGDDPRRVAWSAMMDELQVLDLIGLAERYRYLFKSVYWAIAYREGQVCLDLYVPDEIRVDESDIQPSRLEWARAIYLGNAQPIRSGTYDRSPTSYTVWTRHGSVTDSEGVTWGSYQIDEFGKVLENPVFPDNINPYGFHPVLAWYEVIPTRSVFPPLDEALVQANRLANCKFTILNEIANFAGFGLLVKYVRQSDGSRLPRGPRAVYEFVGRIESGEKIDVVKPDADLSSLLEHLDRWLRYNAVLRGLPGTVLDTKVGSIETGEGVRQRRVDLREVRLSRGPRMIRDLKRLLLDLCVPIWDYWAERRGHPELVIGADRPVDVWIGLASLELDPASIQSEQQARALAYQAGTDSPARVILEEQMGIPAASATREQWGSAIIRAKQNRRLYAQLQAIEAIDGNQAETQDG